MIDKKKIVIDNYFKTDCNIDTTIREAYRKGFERALQKCDAHKTDDVKQSGDQPIDYQTCSDAMLKMWMEKVLTDGEYNRVMDKLNKAHGEGKL